MNEFIEKLIERLEEYCKPDCDGDCTKCHFTSAVGTVNQLAEDYNNGWIPCEKDLPQEPERKLDEIENIKEAILHNKVTGYVVTIKGASESTVLYYVGDGYWYDEETEDFYNVIAWQHLPPVYQPKGELL